MGEAKLWEYLRVERIRAYKFRRQHAVGPYIVDFYYPSAKLVIEVDGPIHERQVDDDAIRTAFLEEMGLRVIRVTNDQILNEIDLTRDLIFQHLLASPSPPGEEGA